MRNPRLLTSAAYMLQAIIQTKPCENHANISMGIAIKEKELIREVSFSSNNDLDEALNAQLATQS